MKSIDQVNADIRILGLPKIMSSIWDGNRGLPKEFAEYYSAPFRFLEKWSRLVMFDVRYSDYVPLFEPQDDAVYAFDLRKRVYIERYFEDREPTEIGRSFNQLLGFIFANLADSGLEEVAVEASPVLGFPYLNEYLSYCSGSSSGDPFVDRSGFVDLIGQIEAHGRD